MLARFTRTFLVSGVLSALATREGLSMLAVEPQIIVPVSALLGALLGVVLGGLAAALYPERPHVPGFLGVALAMSSAGWAAGLALWLVGVYSTPLPRGYWVPMELQPPKAPVALLGESTVQSEKDPDLYVLTNDGSVYACTIVAFRGPSEWREVSAAESPATRLGAASFGREVPRLPQNMISGQKFAIRGVDYVTYSYHAIAEDGIVWQCAFAQYGITMVGGAIYIPLLYAAGGLASSFALLFERKLVANKSGPEQAP